MAERGILFSGPMVRAILEGRKTMTRRIVKGGVSHGEAAFAIEAAAESGWIAWFGEPRPDIAEFTRQSYQHGFPSPHRVGDTLWVRETWASATPYIVAYQADGECGAWMGDGAGGRIWSRHGGVMDHRVPHRDESWHGGSYGLAKFGGKWRPSIFMPRWASRITLRVTDVRVERLQAITWQDAIAEGVESDEYLAREEWEASVAPAGSVRSTPISEYARLWDEINGRGSWEANPWVWAYTFERIDNA